MHEQMIADAKEVYAKHKLHSEGVANAHAALLSRHQEHARLEARNRSRKIIRLEASLLAGRASYEAERAGKKLGAACIRYASQISEVAPISYLYTDEAIADMQAAGIEYEENNERVPTGTVCASEC